MPELRALDLPAGAGFVDALRAAWDDGDAVLPVDGRLPATGGGHLARFPPTVASWSTATGGTTGPVAGPSIRAMPWSSPPAEPAGSRRAWS